MNFTKNVVLLICLMCYSYQIKMSDADYDAEIHVAGAGASETYPEQCSKMRKGTYVMIKNHPCKVMEMSTSKTGKHGHAKVIIFLAADFRSQVHVCFVA